MYQFAKSMGALRSSEIRDLMRLATRPDIISFAGGMPNNELFPVKEIEKVYSHLPIETRRVAFQYGPTAGYPPLLESLRNYLRKKGLPVEKNKLMITTGSLQAINLLTKDFIDPGDVILTENPCFIGAISAFKYYQAKIESIPIDKDGVLIEPLQEKLESLPPNQPKMMYITPNFHNPAGIIYSKKRRKELLDVLAKHNEKDSDDIVLLEDDAYNEIYFSEEAKELTTPLKCNEPENVKICYTGSFSKILGPGFRLGWMLVEPDIFEKAELAKQAMDACSPNFTQVLANEFMREQKLQPYLEFLRKEYKFRKDLMQENLEKYMPEEVSWYEPQGGFYYWFTLPDNIDATEIMKKSVEKGAVFVTGRTFDPDGKRNNKFRLSFSNMKKEQMKKGIEIISEAAREVLQENMSLKGV